MDMILLNVSKELYIHRFRNGIKLMPATIGVNGRSHKTSTAGHSVEKVLSLPICVHFANTDSINQCLNDLTAEASGYDSTKQAIGTSLFEVLTPESATKLVKTDKEVLKSQNLKIVEDTVFRKDDIDLHTLSFKQPWYNPKNKIIGVFGCTILLGKQKLDESLRLISDVGLFDSGKNYSINYGKEVNGLYLSKREIECLKLTIRGKSAKQVAYAMGISQRTVEEYLNNIKNKMGVFSKSDLIDRSIDLFF